jgi:hypothetical protein
MATKKENKRKKVRLYLTVIAGFVVLAGVCAALAAPPEGKGGGGKKGSDVILVRADFVAGSAIDSDSGGRIPVPPGFTPCDDGFHPDGGLWDYWDPRDPVCDHGGQLKSDLSGGDRWIFNTGVVRPTERWAVFHWDLIQAGPDLDLARSAVTDASDPDLDQLIYVDPVVGKEGPRADSTSQVDNLNIRMSADVVFKPNATRQPLSILIQQGGGSWPIYSLSYLEPLYVVPNYNGDSDLTLLTTVGSGGNPDVHEAKLVELVDPTTGDSHKGKSKPVVGTYRMPFKVIVRRVFVQSQ